MKNPDGTTSTSVGDNNDGLGCAAAKVKPTSNGQPAPVPPATGGQSTDDASTARSYQPGYSNDVEPQEFNFQYRDPRFNSDPNAPSDAEKNQMLATLVVARTSHDLGCAGQGWLGWAVQGPAIAASAEIIPKRFAAGGRSGTSIWSTFFGDLFSVKSTPTPVGMPGTSSFAWRASGSAGRILGRYVPYLGTVAGAASTYKCLGSQP